MREKISKTQAKSKVEKFFADISNKEPEEIRKIKRLAMRHNLKLEEKKKLYCKKCFSVFDSKNSKIRVSKKVKTITCNKCGVVSKYKLK